MLSRLRRALLLSCLLLPGAALVGLLPDAAGDEPVPARTIDFNRDVRPILAERCLSCHGPSKQQSGLRLDRKTDALKGGDTGVDIIPRKSADSRLIQALTGVKGVTQMPPKGDRLTAQQVAVLRTWIDQGAAWPDDLADRPDPRKHWAFQPPTRPQLPEVRDADWCRSPIDRFIIARLEREGLPPSPEADRITLLRRLHLDLIGLPPTPKEVDEFLADKSPEAYSKQVERLLASKHYGERWGRHWLDAARYADSDGYEKDKLREVWFYRDWVVEAHNRDLPYDRFILEQLAGDLLPDSPGRQDQVVATGFLRNSMLNEEGGVDPEQFRMDAMFDRMDALGKAVLGLSITCAQCHNHKYDPLTQEEYYRLFAYLNSDYESQRVVYSADEQMKTAELRRRMREVEDRLRHETPGWEERMARWEDSVRGMTHWEVVKVANAGDNGQRYFDQKDGSLLAQGYAPTKFTAHFTGTSPLPKVRSFRLELLNDANLPCNGPGRSFMGTCALTEFRVEAADAKEPAKKVKVKLVRATADYSNPEHPLEPIYDDRSGKKRITGPVAFAIDGKNDTAWGIDAGPGRRNVPRQAVFVAEQPIDFANGIVLNFFLEQNHGGWNSDDNQNHNLGRFRLSVTDTEAVADPVPAAVRTILAVPREKRTPAQVATVFGYWRTTVPEFKKANEEIEELWKQWPAGATALTLQPREEMRTTHVLKRGDFLEPVKAVSPGVPSFLHQLTDKDAPQTRLTMARWLADRRSPTTARAFVNRVWQTYFGTGIVSTSEDLGTQSDRPSHPELLDWLAVEFMEPSAVQPGDTAQAASWSIKHLHRLIVHSAAYRQSSRVTPELLQKDPYNRLLTRASRLRVEGEVVRDITLAASGLLNPKIGGPAVFTPAPQFLFKPPASYGPFEWPDATGADRYRRGLYTFRRRSTPYPALQTFDVPPGESSCVRRTRSNTPLQALTTLNETVFMESARGLAARMIREGGKSDEERIVYGFRCCVSRPPSTVEKTALLKLLESQRKRLATPQLNAIEIATGEKNPPGSMPAGATATELASYTLVARVLLNLDETITRE